MSAMETIRHHLSERLLLAYAAGTLPEAFGVVVATHVSLCDECRAQTAAFDAVGGALLEGFESVYMEAGALERVLGSMRGPAPASAPAPLRAGGGFPEPLRSYVGDHAEAVRWRAIGGGVRQSVLRLSGQAQARLIRIPAGVAVPEHGHRGTEITLVLSGAYRDATARFGPGDVEVAGPEMEHQPIAEQGEDCICLAASDARMRFRGLLPRLAQPFIGI
jgi:putative transcriptional regulator